MYAGGKRRDIQLLLAGGVPQERIAQLTGVSVRTIRRIGRESAQPGWPWPSQRRRKRPGQCKRPGRVGPRRWNRIARPWRRCWRRGRN